MEGVAHRIPAFKNGDREGLAVAVRNGEFHGMWGREEGRPGNLDLLVQNGHDALDSGAVVLVDGMLRRNVNLLSEKGLWRGLKQNRSQG
jgi:hypothetical protein